VATLAVTAAVAAFLAFVPGAVPAQAVPADAVLRNFEISGDFALTIDGKEQPKAELYFSESARAFLLIAPEFPSPLLVSAPTQSVDSLDLMKVAKQPSGTIDLLADAVLEPAGKYKVDGPNIEFTYAGRNSGSARAHICSASTPAPSSSLTIRRTSARRATTTRMLPS